MTTRPDPADAYRTANAALDERPADATRAAILAAAARAVDAQPRAAGSPPPRRWRIPLAAAAMVLISTIAVIVAQRTERELPAAVTAEPAPAEQKNAAAPTATRPAEAARSQEKPNAPAIVKAPAPRDRAATVTRGALPPEPARERSEQAAAAAADTATAPSAAGLGAAHGEAPQVAGAPPAAPRAALERRAAAVSDAAESALVTGKAQTPEHWLARIIELRRAARDDEADAELKKLRQRYPQFVIPEGALRRAGTR